jgi:cytochrome c oxidase subunit 2
MLTAILADLNKRDGSFWMPRQSSTVARDVDNLFDFVFWLSVFFFVLITLMIIVFIIKYRHREGVTRDPAAGHSTALELTWTLIPTVLVLVIFYIGFRGFMDMSVEPPNSYEIAVKGQMWTWGYTYENRYASLDGKLHVPVNVPVRLILSSEDVIHSYYIPAFRVKKDVVPGRFNRMWFKATETGEFDVYCAEYCGQQHSRMLSNVVVHTMPDFEKWLEDTKDWTKVMSPLDAGKMLYETSGCTQCHSIDGKVIVGPTFKDLFGNQVPIVGQGNVLADENYIRESILTPQAKIHQGFGPPSPMPSFLGRFNDNDIGAIIAYMKSISSNFKGDLTPFKQIKPKGSATKPATQPAGAGGGTGKST